MKKSLNFSFFEIWRDHGLTSEKHKVMTFVDFVALDVSKDIFMIQTLYFWKKKLSLSVSHQNRRFFAKKRLHLGQKWAKIVGNRQSQFFWGKQTKWILLSHKNFFRQYLTDRIKVMPVFPPLINRGGFYFIFRKSDTTFHWFLTCKITFRDFCNLKKYIL